MAPARLFRMANRVYCLLGILALMALGGCTSTTARPSMPTPTATPRPLDRLTVYSVQSGVLSARRASDGALLWTYPPVKDPLSRTLAAGYPPSLGFMPGPAVANGIVYGGTMFGVMFALDARDGHQLWSVQLDTPSLRLSRRNLSEYSSGYDKTPIHVQGGLVYITTMALQDAQYNDLFALDAVTGHTRWHARLRRGSPPVFADGNVYVGTTLDSAGTGQVVAFDAATGKVRWHAGIVGYLPRLLAVADGFIYAAVMGVPDPFNYPRVVALRERDGSPAWRGSGVDAGTTAVVAGGLLYLPSNDGHLRALDARTGAVRWSVTLASGVDTWFSGIIPLVSSGAVYVGAPDHNFYAFDATTGKQLWKVDIFADQPYPAPPRPDTHRVSGFTAPVLAEDTLYFLAGRETGQLMPRPFGAMANVGVYALRAADGVLRWRAVAPWGEITAPPAIAPTSGY